MIDWVHFTPWSALLGGVLIGLSSALLVLLNGRILGVSGILGGLLSPQSGDISWRICFLLGLFCSPMFFFYAAPSQWIPLIQIEASYGFIILGGLLVGFGARYGSGCTSGHGVCGLARLSLRSMVATLSFMGAGFVSVYFMRHIL